MELINKIANIGVGQCGGNFVSSLEKLGHQAYYINTSLEDLESINTNPSNTYHIKGTKGMAKDIELALETICKDGLADTICFGIYNEFANSTIFNFYFSLQGGTGAPIGGILASTMSEMFPDKIVNVICVKGKNNEDIGLQANSIKSLERLLAMYDDGLINNIQILDNNSRDDKMQVNNDFASTMDRIIKFDSISSEGNLDQEELERLLTTRGIVTILEFEADDFANGLSEACDKSIYSEWLKDSQLQGLILNKRQDNDINRELIREIFGLPTYTHSTNWAEANNIIISVGAKFNKAIISNIKKNLNEMIEKKKRLETELIQQQNEVEDVEVDLSTIGMPRRNKPRTTQQETTSSTSRRRGVKSASAMIDKYRNM